MYNHETFLPLSGNVSRGFGASRGCSILGGVYCVLSICGYMFRAYVRLMSLLAQQNDNDLKSSQVLRHILKAGNI